MNAANSIYLWIKKNMLGYDDRSQLQVAIDNGLKIGKNYAVMGETIIDPGHCFLITIGDNVTLAPRVHILAHDASTKRELGYTRIAKVNIGNNVFIGANSVVMPGVNIGDNCIIGAGSVVSRSIPSNSVAVGNPCRVIKSYDLYMDEQRKILENSPKFDSSYQITRITEEKKKEMCESLKDHSGFIV